jgi:hypothetical protein
MQSNLKPYLKLNWHSNENGGMVFHMITTTHVCCPIAFYAHPVTHDTHLTTQPINQILISFLICLC